LSEPGFVGFRDLLEKRKSYIPKLAFRIPHLSEPGLNRLKDLLEKEKVFHSEIGIPHFAFV